MNKILLIEDDILLRNTLDSLLADRLYQTFTTSDGEIGLKKALNEQYDLIILDLTLPRLSGFIILKRIRDAGKQTPILIISSKNKLSDLQTALNYGADGYLYKPFNKHELVSRAEALIRRPPQERPCYLEMGSLVFDSTICQASFDGKPLKLQKRQLDILEYLMKNPNRIVSKYEIINSIWEYDSRVLPGTIDVHLSRLRMALKSRRKGPRITSYHKYGIKLAN